MIHFPILRMHSMNVKLKELTLGNALAISYMPPDNEQEEITAFLRFAVENKEETPDPALWTVQERMLAIAHYLASMSDEKNFLCSNGARFSDYLDTLQDHVEPVQKLGEACGDEWYVVPLTGRLAESIERLQGEVTDGAENKLPGHLHWIIGAMAAMLRRSAVAETADMSESQLDDWIKNGMRVFLAYPESDFSKVVTLWVKGRLKTDHYFRIDFSEEGIVALPKEGAHFTPVRFPCRACLSGFTKEMA